MGNAGWRRKNQAQLVRAAYDDTVSMYMQNLELQKFSRNEGSSTGRGPSDKERNRKDHNIQRQEASQYCEVLKMVEAIQTHFESTGNLPPTLVKVLQAELFQQEENFIPSHTARHGAPKKPSGVQGAFEKPRRRKQQEKKTSSQGNSKTQSTLSDVLVDMADLCSFAQRNDADDLPNLTALSSQRRQTEGTRGRGRGQAKGARSRGRGSITSSPALGPSAFGANLSGFNLDVEQLDAKLHDAVQRAEEMIGSQVKPYSPRETPGKQRHPFTMVYLTQAGNVSKCFGCPKERRIMRTMMAPPYNILFRCQGERPKLNSRDHSWYNSVGPIYFHCNPKCLRAYDPTFQLKNVRCTDEVFSELTQAQMNLLKELGFLHPLTAQVKGRF